MTANKEPAKTWRRACTCRNGATTESPGLNLGPDGVPVCKVCGTPWKLVEKKPTEGVPE